MPMQSCDEGARLTEMDGAAKNDYAAEPNAMPHTTTHAETINADLLAFIRD